MKKVFALLFVLGFIFSGTSSLIAGGIDNKHNYSAEYIRTLNRNAATDSADAVVYNPAGVVKMGDGFYLNLSAQYAFKIYSNTVDGIEYEDDEPNIIPSLFCLYKQDRWAAFAAFTIPAGGGAIKYENGNATTVALGQGIIAGSGGFYDTIKNQRLEAESIYYGYTVGTAFALNDMISVSLGARYIDAKKEAKGSVTVSGLAPDLTAELDYEETADGWGGIVGVNIAPNKELNIGIRYETKTRLDFQTEVKKDDLGLLGGGERVSRNLPALLGLGVAYTITPKVKVEANLTYYFNEDAEWGDKTSTPRDESKGDDGYDVGIALEYTFNPRLKGSMGYMYTNVGIDPDDMMPEAPELDGHTVAAGFCYEAIPGLNLNLGLERTFFLAETTSTGVEYNKEVMVIALGIQYKF